MRSAVVVKMKCTRSLSIPSVNLKRICDEYKLMLHKETYLIWTYYEQHYGERPKIIAICGNIHLSCVLIENLIRKTLLKFSINSIPIFCIYIIESYIKQLNIFNAYVLFSSSRFSVI